METAAGTPACPWSQVPEPSLLFSGAISELLRLLKDQKELLTALKTGPDLAAVVALTFLLQAWQWQLPPSGVVPW